MKSVYIVRGAPASGKGTLVPEFAKLLQTPVAHIDQDVFRWNFHLVGRQVSDVSDAEHMFAYQSMVALYERYLQNGSYTLVLEGLFTWDNVSSSQGNVKELLTLANQYGFATKSIVLRADKNELLQRNAARAYAVPADEFELLYDAIYTVVDSSETVIDSTGQTVEETLAGLRRLI